MHDFQILERLLNAIDHQADFVWTGLAFGLQDLFYNPRFACFQRYRARVYFLFVHDDGNIIGTGGLPIVYYASANVRINFITDLTRRDDGKPIIASITAGQEQENSPKKAEKFFHIIDN